MKNKSPEIAYRYWQDRATSFYWVARMLFNNNPPYSPEVSPFCAYQAIENMIKAALEFHSKKYEKIHGLQTLVELLEECGINITIPSYFDDFQQIPRYPESRIKGEDRGAGLNIPETFLDDLDKIISEIILQIRDKGTTRLKNLLKENSRYNQELSRNNKYYSKLKSFYLS